MIQGKTIKPHGEIVRKTVNYRTLDGLNCSMIKLFDTDPIKFFEIFKLGKEKKENKTTSLILGDLVDFYLLDCRGDWDEFNQRFDEKFALFEGKKGTGQVFILADLLFEVTQENTEGGVVQKSFDSLFSEAFRRVQQKDKYKGGTEEKAMRDFNDNGREYYDSLIENSGKIVIDVSLLDKAKKIADLLKEDEFTSEIFKDDDSNIEYFPKFTIEWKYKILKDIDKSIDCKSEIDILKIDHNKKIIYPKDLKTTFDNENFEYSYVKYRYDLQAAFYYLAVKYWAFHEGMGEYSVIPMEFIVGDTSSNNRRPVRYRLSMNDIERALKGYTLRGVKYKGLLEIVEEISWAENTGNWNVSKEVFDNQGILKLGLKYES